MRQGDGADLLGANDPRSASIGMIYVAPTDDRQSVLAAILTQDKLGRKQVAVVLPENNRAFQRPVDFDGLKNMRRGLKTEIVFVAPPGPGPAEFARQRRFTVFSSLENYASSLRADATDNGGAKKGLFGRKQKPASPNDRPVPTTDVLDMRRPLPYPGAAPKAASPQPSDQFSDDEVTQKDDRHEAPLIGLAGLAGVAGATALGANLSDNEDDLLPPPPSSSPPQRTNNSSTTASPNSVDENARTVGANGPSRPIEPGIIAFPTSAPRPRTTAKLPASPAAQPDAASGTPPTRNGNTGKRSVVIPGAAAGAAAAGLGAAALYGRTPTGVSGQPPAAPPGTGSSSGGPRRRRTRQLLALLLIILTLLLLAGIAFASPAGQGMLSHILPGDSTPMATVTITPTSKLVANNFEIFGVTGVPTAKAQQVQARILTSPPSASSATAGATGSIPGRRATGTLLFINTATGSIPIQGGTVTGGDGVSVSFNGPITVPPGSITVLGTAVDVGVRGNIKAFDIAGAYCCGGSILVRNPAAFSGGQDPIPHSVVTQNDINTASNMLIASLKPKAQAQLQSQVKKNEQVVANSLHCTPHVSANHNPGDHATSVTVTGTVTCTEEAYDHQAALGQVSNLLMAQAAKDPGAGYALVGTIVITLPQPPTVDSKQTVTLVFHAVGVWAYQFTDAIKAQLAKAIANQTKEKALAYLQAVAGVSSVSISSGTTLPDAAHIMFVINPVPGATGTPTSGSPTPGSTPTSAPPLTPTSGLGGS